MMNPMESAVAAWRGATAVDHDGEKIGTIDEIYAPTPASPSGLRSRPACSA